MSRFGVLTLTVGVAVTALLGSSLSASSAEASTPQTLSGTIIEAPEALVGDQSAEPRDCTILLVSLNGAPPTVNRTGCGGYHFDNVDPGGYLVFVTPNAASGRWAPAWHGDSPYRSGATVVTVAGSPVTGIDVSLPFGGQITGRIDVSGQPAAEAVRVYASLVDPRTGAVERETIPGTVGAGGLYEIRGLPAGSFVVEADAAEQYSQLAPTYFGDATSLDAASRVSVAGQSTSTGVNINMKPVVAAVSRIAGADRYATSAAISQSGFAPGVPVVYVSSGTNWPDALSAGPAAAHLGGTLLLTHPEVLPEVVKAELKRLAPRRIVVTGSEAAVSASVFNTLRGYAQTVDRIGGTDRYATSRAIIRDAFGSTIASRTIYIATGEKFPDALSAGAAAAGNDAPLLLVNTSAWPADEQTNAFLWPTSFVGMVIAGSDATISDPAARALASATNYGLWERVGGADRFATSDLFAREAGTWPARVGGAAFVATGLDFPDAISAIPLAAKRGAPVLLTRPNCLSAGTLLAAREIRTSNWILLGGPTTLTPSVEALAPC